METRAGSARLEVREEQPWGCQGSAPGTPRLPCTLFLGLASLDRCSALLGCSDSFPQETSVGSFPIDPRALGSAEPPSTLGPETAGTEQREPGEGRVKAAILLCNTLNGHVVNGTKMAGVNPW